MIKNVKNGKCDVQEKGEKCYQTHMLKSEYEAAAKNSRKQFDANNQKS